MTLKTFFIETHGCQMNVHDSEKIAGLLAHRGLTAVASAGQADLYILNTCSVREKAVHKVYSRLGELRLWKQNRPRSRIGVVGCVAQQESEEMVKRAPYVDLVVGTHLYHTIPDLLDELDSGSQQVATRFLEDPAPVEISPIARENSFRASITIMEGCNKRCAFCIVPFTRGRERNRPAEAIITEARRAVDQGYLEILLLGQTVNSYKDPQRPRYKFARLLEDLARIEGLERLRFTSPHPRHFSREVISVIAEHRNICNQLHIPLQSGSSRILRRMMRQHDQQLYLDLIDRFRRCGRPITFSTDIIVGFPGETEEDFHETLEVVRQVEYENMFSFKYSPRPNSEAFQWPDSVPEEEKTRRLMILQRLQRQIQLRLHQERYIDRCFDVITEGVSRDGENRYGRTESNKIVNFAGSDPTGSCVRVRITGAGPNSLAGHKVENAAEVRA